MSQESLMSNASTDLQDMSRSNEDNINSLRTCVNNHECAERELLILSKCLCCNRHQQNKPKHFTAWVELLFMGPNTLLVNVIVGIFLDLFVVNIQTIIVKYYILVYLFKFLFFLLVAERKKN